MFGQTGTAERTLRDGRVDDAVQMLKAQISTHGSDGGAYLLLCRAYYSEMQYEDAVSACQNAVRLMPASSEAEDWMGRAYGGRADKAGPLAGLKLAHEVHDAFEAAVRLDPHSAEAANDLAEYYIGAPSFVDGGLDKADALATRIEGDLPEVAHRVRAMAAEKRRDFGTAEREFLAAIAVKHRAEAWVDLAGFYKRRKLTAKGTDACDRALAADRARGPASVDAASYLIELKAEADIAMKALQQYLAGPNKSDAAPVIRVYVLMSKLKAASGDKAGAKIELNQALSLAANYPPAKEALKGL